VADSRANFSPVPSEKRMRQRENRKKKAERLERQARRRKAVKRASFVVIVAAVVAGIAFAVNSSGGSSKSQAATGPDTQAAVVAADKAAGCPASPTAAVPKQQWPSPPPMTIVRTDSYTATVETDIGTFKIALDAKDAPVTVNSFVFLARHGFYNCVTFHRVINGFMDQTGDPTGTGTGGPGYHFANENVPSSYATGDVAMANSGGTDSNGSQFFVVVPGGAATLNSDLKSGAGYSLFGHVISGMNVVEKINSDGSPTGVPRIRHRMLRVTISVSGPRH
jgi:cyclophilin family peptidyl-prolyl cis-trans isomerase